MSSHPTLLFAACAISALVLLSGCAKPVDPTTVSAAPATTTQAFRAAKEGEQLTAMVYVARAHAPGSFSTKVESVEQCLAYGREATYIAGHDDSVGKISCLGEDMAPVARFVCKSETARCESVLKF